MPASDKSRLIAAAASLLVLTWAGGAGAGVLLTDNFDAENGGVGQLNYGGFANWNVTDGTVDLIQHASFGINCFGGGGMCVDLDGSTGNAGIMTTKTGYAFNAGDTLTLSFQARGNDRGGALDTLLAGFTFADPTDLSSFSSGGFGLDSSGALLGLSDFSYSDTLASEDDYALYTLGFTAASAGVAFAFVQAQGGDNIGPILDNVSLATSSPTGAIPEPSTWALMLVGFGSLGAMLRRRRAATPEAAAG